jgi:hypothetical protein
VPILLNAYHVPVLILGHALLVVLGISCSLTKQVHTVRSALAIALPALLLRRVLPLVILDTRS